MPLSEPIVLRDHQWRIRILPAFGGGLDECVFREQALLQSVDPESSLAAVELCYFPLVPFSNRIRNGRFSFEGRTVDVGPNLRNHSHAIHGHGWQAPWRVLHADASQCTLVYEHAASARWPWRYRVLQTFAIDGAALTITLTLTNEAATRMPTGLGFHPFFARPGTARLAAAASRLWNGRAEEFPSRSIDVPAELDFAVSRAVREARGVDHCYSGWDGTAAIDWPDAPHRLLLEAGRELGHFLLYVPENRDFFCFEPVSHAINAFNYPAAEENAALGLAPAQELSATMTLRCGAEAPGLR
jgi:aldose 1-epimerase